MLARSRPELDGHALLELLVGHPLDARLQYS
jgi:hypothetical protein